jgi:hypothetical protein
MAGAGWPGGQDVICLPSRQAMRFSVFIQFRVMYFQMDLILLKVIFNNSK